MNGGPHLHGTPETFLLLGKMPLYFKVCTPKTALIQSHTQYDKRRYNITYIFFLEFSSEISSSQTTGKSSNCLHICIMNTIDCDPNTIHICVRIHKVYRHPSHFPYARSLLSYVIPEHSRGISVSILKLWILLRDG